VIRAASTLSAPSALGDARTDEELLTSFSRGEGDALGELFDRHHRSIYRFLSRSARVRDADLDDLVQATFVEAARSAPRYDGRASVRTWLFGIAVNVGRHHVRSLVRRRKWMADTEEERPSQVPGRDRPDHAAEHREMLERLSRAVDALPDPLREVFVACEIEDLPGAEVARVLGIREGTLWRRLHDARMAVRTALGGNDS
jgi:RNA polymerase sigma-70 factor (ECF subfamily)